MALKRWQRDERKKRRDDRMKLLKSIMHGFPDQVAMEIIERHTELKQTFTEIAHVLGLHKDTVKYKYERVLPIIREIVKCREKLQ